MTRPAALLAWVLCALIVALSSTNPAGRALVLMAGWALLYRRRAAGRSLRPLAIGTGILGVTSTLTNGLLSHTGATVIATLPGWVPLLGGPMTLEGFSAGAAIGLGLAAAVSVTAALSVVAEPGDLLDALPGFLARTAITVGAALNLVPALAESYGSIRDAQRCRGWRGRGPRGLADLMVPLLLGAIERSGELAEAMEARAFGSGRRTRTAPDHSARNGAVTAGSFAALAWFAAGRLSGAGSWYPYPAMMAPQLGASVVGPPLLLGLLAFAVPESPA